MRSLVLSLGPSWRPLAACLVASSLALACASTHLEDPETVLHTYARALEEGRADDAYRLLSDSVRRGISLEAFRRMTHDNADDVREIGRALGRKSSPAVITATVTGEGGQELELVLEHGVWKIDASAVDLYAQDTPRHAIQGFTRALERKRYDVILKYVPDGHKDGLDAAKLKAAWEGHDKEEMDQVLAALKQALPSAAIEETGERATMPYGAGTLQLVREHGLWKVENFD